MIQHRDKAVVGYALEVSEADRPLLFVEIPEVYLIPFERGFRPSVPQAEVMVVVGGRTIGHHFASQSFQRMDETAAFIDRIDARSRVDRGIVVREQQFIPYLIIQGFPRVDDGAGWLGRLARTQEQRKQKNTNRKNISFHNIYDN